MGAECLYLTDQLISGGAVIRNLIGTRGFPASAKAPAGQAPLANKRRPIRGWRQVDLKV